MRQGTPGFNGNRLKEAREMRGFTITSLADMIGVSKTAISRYEKGECDGKLAFTPRPEVLDKITDALKFPKMFFFQESFISNDTPIYYRSLSSATKAARLKAESQFTWLQEIVNTVKNYVELPSVNLQIFDVKDHTKISFDDIEDFATATRRYWGLGDGPISSVLTLLENNGVIVSRLDLEADSLDALSKWATHDSAPYVFLSSSKQSSVRSRFDLSHELSHLVCHSHLTKGVCCNPIHHPEIERQAHRFASAFLLPARSFTNDLVSTTLDGFWALKDKWKVSIKAMIYRCKDLEIIDEDYSHKLFINYNRRGWGKREPLDDKIPIEQPKILRRSYELLVNENIITREDILDAMPYPVHVLEDLIGLPRGFLLIRDNVEYLPTLKRAQPTEAHARPNEAKIISFPFKK
ncbi:MAG: XRE family transcriptional regulator [Methylococcales bacterium]